MNAFEHGVGDLVAVDPWVAEMISDSLPLTSVPAPSYAAAAVGYLRVGGVGVVIRIATIDNDDDAPESYSYVLTSEGVGWVNSSYLERLNG